MLRDQDRSNSFTPVNNAEKNEWVFANIDEMAAHTGSEAVLVDEIFSASPHCSFHILELTRVRRRTCGRYFDEVGSRDAGR